MAWTFSGYYVQQDILNSDGSALTNITYNNAFETPIKIASGATTDTISISDGRDVYELAGDAPGDAPTDATQTLNSNLIFYEVIRTFTGSDGQTYTAIIFDYDQDGSGAIQQDGANVNGFYEQSYFMAFISNDFAADLASGTLYQSSFAAATPPPPGTTLTPNPVIANTGSLAVICFSKGTSILCEGGLKPVEDLAVGDKVWTMDGGVQPIRWIGSRKFTKQALAAYPHLYPIRIRAGALGENSPETDLCVSPQHRMLVSSKIAQRMFGQAEILVAAKHLLSIKGVEVADDVTEVEYYHFMFDDHQIVWADGAYAESLYAGAEGLKSLTDEGRKEILEIFPELADDQHEVAAARKIISGQQARHLTRRHIVNHKMLSPEVRVAH